MCDLFVTYFLAGGQNHFPAAKTNEFRDPGRGTDAGVRPRLAVNSQPFPYLAASFCDRHKFLAHLFNKPIGLLETVGYPTQETNVILNIGQQSGIHGQEVEGMLEKLGHGFMLVWHRSNDERWIQPKDLVYRIHVPAIAEFWQPLNGCNFRAPFCHANEICFGANGTEDGSRARGERDNAKRGFRCSGDHAESLAEQKVYCLS
jgi:hypothetical protein